MQESLGPLLTRARLARGWSQLRVAELLCAASGSATITRHEVSRWEREDRIPSGFWLGWLALVLETRIEELSRAADRTRRRRPDHRLPAGEPGGAGPFGRATPATARSGT